MTERNPYSQQYNYDTYDQPSSRRGAEAEPSFGERMKARFSNPVFATVALLLTAAAFTGIIIASYPDKGAESDVPVIQASIGDLHGQPPENGGLDAPDADSTVFNNIRSSEMNEQPPVEDLLAEEKPIDKLEAFAREAESMFDERKEAMKATSVAPSETAEITETVEAAEPAAAPSDSPRTIKIEQHIEKIPPQIKTSSAETGTGTAQIKQPAGSAPETLAFVKSVLNEKDTKAVAPKIVPPAEMQAINTKADITQPALQKIEPAAGAAATSGSAIVSGSYYVQLGSVISEDGASTEWKRLQKTFGALDGAQYRVQKADLGERGVRYRIQAGPMSRDIAGNVCDTIKTQKPGGCIVVQ